MLRSINLTNLGGPMGSESTFSNFEKPFKSMKEAKEYGEKDYETSGRKEKIKWSNTNGNACSGDLDFVMYEIEKINM